MSEYEGIRGFRVRYVSSDPTLNSGSTGDVWYNSTTGVNKALVDAEVQASQAAWDAQSDEEKAEPNNIRPGEIKLP